jgi:hypothetical protein
MSIKSFHESPNAGFSGGLRSQEYSRILTAAVVNSHFRQMLLANPAKAIAGGFGGEAFSLASDEKKRLSSIKANSLADFARQLTQPDVSRMAIACSGD